MERVLLCTGDYAQTPYCFENLGIRVFSAEELCYVLKENAFLLDREIVDRRLVKWIDESLHLPKLAASLYPLLHQKTSVGAFAGMILEYVGFYDAETIRRTEEIFRTGANLNAYEKLKSRVDYMVGNGRYSAALVEYDALLEQLPEGEKELTAKILHNKGVALCGLFAFEEAASQFRKAYELVPDRESMISYLAAKRLSMDEGDYISFAAGFPEYYEETLELERRVVALREQWEQSEQKDRLDWRRSLKADGDVRQYYAETNKRVQELKNAYRAGVNG